MISVVFVLLTASDQFSRESDRKIVYEGVELVEDINNAILLLPRRQGYSYSGETIARYATHLRSCDMTLFVRLKFVGLEEVRDVFWRKSMTENKCVTTDRYLFDPALLLRCCRRVVFE